MVYGAIYGICPKCWGAWPFDCACPDDDEQPEYLLEPERVLVDRDDDLLEIE